MDDLQNILLQIVQLPSVDSEGPRRVVRVRIFLGFFGILHLFMGVCLKESGVVTKNKGKSGAVLAKNKGSEGGWGTCKDRGSARRCCREGAECQNRGIILQPEVPYCQK